MIRIFVSSPGDVGPEREVAVRVIARLRSQYAGVLDIEGIFWEHEPLRATESFQPQIPTPDESDIYVCILWSRLGTRLPREVTGDLGDKTGTEYEFELAHESFKDRNQPDFLVYIKRARVVGDFEDVNAARERIAQKEALDAFVERWFFGTDGTLIAAHHQFEDTGRFEELLEQHLRTLLKQRAPQVSGGEGKPEPWWFQGSPFRGLRFFDFEHAPVFFGRTQAIGHVLDAVRRQMGAQRAFVLVLGMSGGGKSSLVRAGVLPYLVLPGVIEGVGLWRRAVMRPSDAGIDLFRGLAQALLRAEALPELSADGTQPEELAVMLKENPAGADPLLKGALSQSAFAVQQIEKLEKQPRARLALVVDQLEEIWTLEGITAKARADFVRALASLSRSGRVAVLATLRSDFYHRCEELPELMELKAGAGEYQLKPATPAEIGQMVRLPALAAGLRYEVELENGARLDDVLRDTAAQGPEALPLLEFALDELYEVGQADGLLSFADYEEIGGLEGAIAQRAERSFQDFTAAHNLKETESGRLLGELFSSLVAVGSDDASVTRRYAALDILRDSSGLLRSLIEIFVEARLFTTDRTEDGVNTLSVAHETLLDRWTRLRNWIDRNRETLIIRQRVSEAAARWEASGRSEDLLLTQGLPLAEAQALLHREESLVDAALADLVQASAAHWQRIARQRRRVATTVSGVIAVLLLSVAYVSFYAFRQAEQDAQRIAEERGRAERQQQEAELQAQRNQESLERSRQRSSNEYMQVISNNFEGGHYNEIGQSLLMIEPRDRNWEWGYYLLQEIHPEILFLPHAKYSHGAFIDSDKFIVTQSPGTTSIACAATGELLKSIPTHFSAIHPAARNIVISEAYRRNNRQHPGDLILYSVSERKQVSKLHSSSDLPKWLAYSSEGKRILTAKENGEVFLWDAESGLQILNLAPGTFLPPHRYPNIERESHDWSKRILAFNDQKCWLFVSTTNRDIDIFGLDGKCVHNLSLGRYPRLYSLEIANDGETLFASDFVAREEDSDHLRIDLPGDPPVVEPESLFHYAIDTDSGREIWRTTRKARMNVGLATDQYGSFLGEEGGDGRLWDIAADFTEIMHGHEATEHTRPYWQPFSNNGLAVVVERYRFRTGLSGWREQIARVSLTELKSGIVSKSFELPDYSPFIQLKDAEINVATGRSDGAIQNIGLKHHLGTASLDSRGERLLVNGSRGLRVFSVEKHRPGIIWGDSFETFLRVAFSADGQRVATLDRNGSVRVHVTTTGEVVCDLDTQWASLNGEKPVSPEHVYLVFDAEAKHLLIGKSSHEGGTHNIGLWRIEDEKGLLAYEFPFNAGGGAEPLKFSHDQEKILAIRRQSQNVFGTEILSLRLDSGEVESLVDLADSGDRRVLFMHPDGTSGGVYLFYVDRSEPDDSPILGSVYSERSGLSHETEIFRKRRWESGPDKFAASVDSTNFLLAADNYATIVHRERMAQPVYLAGWNSSEYKFRGIQAFSPDSSRLCTIHTNSDWPSSQPGDTIVHVWDTYTGGRTASIPVGRVIPRAASFSPDGLSFYLATSQGVVVLEAAPWDCKCDFEEGIAGISEYLREWQKRRYKSLVTSFEE